MCGRTAWQNAAATARVVLGLHRRPFNAMEGFVMATYITLINFTQKGIERIKESPKRLDGVKETLQSNGGEFKLFYLVLGRYDAVLICEAPDDETVAKVVLSIGSRGAVKTETFRAFNEVEYRNIIDSIP